MKTTKIKYIAFALLLTLALVITACGGQDAAPAADDGAQETANTPVADASADEEPAEEATDMESDFDVDPANAELSADMAGYYETLTDASGAPLLAATAELSDDELDYLMDLNTGVTFNDGTLMDADAVVANFNRWFDPEDELRGEGDYPDWVALFGGFKGEVDSEGNLLSSFDGIEKVNDFTVLIHLNRPLPEMLEGLSDPAFSIVSPTALADGQFIGTGGN
jgi:peptide/nickel transport system substrate-binding protein